VNDILRTTSYRRHVVTDTFFANKSQTKKNARHVSVAHVHVRAYVCPRVYVYRCLGVCVSVCL